MGVPGEPVAPTIGSGEKTYANSERLVLREFVEIHAFVQIYPVSHHQVLMARQRDFRIDRRDYVDREIVRADHGWLQFRQKPRRRKSKPRRAVIPRARAG